MIHALIVGYKNPQALARCLASLPNTSMAMVHDNTDNNIGLTKAANILLERAIAAGDRYAMWLNQDVQLRPDTIRQAIEFMDAHPKTAIGGFKQLATDDPDQIIHGGTRDAWPAGVHLGGRASMRQCEESRPFGWVNMAGCILRLDAIRHLGLLDPQFFLVGQDSDICLRAWAMGWEVWYIADAVCLHDRDGCSAKPTPEQIAIIRRDMDAWSRKWLMVLNGITGADIPIPARRITR